MGNTGEMRAGMQEEGESILTLCWVETSGGIQREMEGDTQISGESEVAARKISKGNAAVSTGSHEIASFRWNTLPGAENQ